MNTYWLITHHRLAEPPIDLVAIVHSDDSMTIVSDDDPAYRAWLDEGNTPVKYLRPGDDGFVSAEEPADKE